MSTSATKFLAAVLLSCAQAVLLQPSICSQSEQHHHQMGGDVRLGDVSFPTSCSAESQQGITRGMALLHSFGYASAGLQFEEVARLDPDCAMAHWGIAMANKQVWSLPTKEQLVKGAMEMEKARALATTAPTITSRELGYIDALSAYFIPEEISFDARAKAYNSKMNALRIAFPEDVDAAAFTALGIWNTDERKALDILEPLFAKHPDHPGLAHYIIHVCDNPTLAQEGLPAAMKYADIAPASPHALHMPGHIFARLGMWQEDIDSNLASIKASQQAYAANQPGAAHQMHAEEFLTYAYLQLGEDEKAHKLVQTMPEIGLQMASMPLDDDMKSLGFYFTNELKSIEAIELHDWRQASSLTPAKGSPIYDSFWIYWAQGIAAGHLRNPGFSAEALKNIDLSTKALKGTINELYASSMIGTMRAEILAWQAFANNRPNEAASEMRRIADKQDKVGQAEVDIPAREMLGDLLLLEGQPAKALVEYQTALKLSPKRLNGLLGAGKAAEEAHHPLEAVQAYKGALQQMHMATGSKRPNVKHAEQFLASSKL